MYWRKRKTSTTYHFLSIVAGLAINVFIMFPPYYFRRFLIDFFSCKAATTWAPPAAFQDGMIGPHWSKGWIIEDCDISNSKCAGISVGKYLDPDNDHYFTYKYVKSPTQMERDAVCRGQYHGWLKEKAYACR